MSPAPRRGDPRFDALGWASEQAQHSRDDRGVAGPQLLAHAVERRPMEGHDGRSGSRLERVRLADGTALVLKRTRPDQDLLTRLTGRGDRELVLYRSGALD